MLEVLCVVGDFAGGPKYFCKNKTPTFSKELIVVRHFYKIILVQYDEIW